MHYYLFSSSSFLIHFQSIPVFQSQVSKPQVTLPQLLRMRNQTLNDLLKRILVAQRALQPLLPVLKHQPRRAPQSLESLDVSRQLGIRKVAQRGLGGGAQHRRGAKVELGGRRGPFARAVCGFGFGGVDGCGGGVVALDAVEGGAAAVGGGPRGLVAGDVDRGQDEFLLLRGGQDLVEVDGDAERDEEEAADPGADPVRGLQGWGRDELCPERVAALRVEDGARVFGGGDAGEVLGGVVYFIDVGLGRPDDGV